MRAAFAAAGLLALATSAVAAQQRFYAAEDRILVGDGGTVRAIAAGPFNVYAAADFGILVFEIARSKWKLPLPLPAGMIATRPSALAVEPTGGTLWLGAESGDVYTTTPGFDRWDRVPAGFRGRVDAIVTGAASGSGAVYILAGGEWLRIEGGSLFAERVPVNALPAAAAERARRSPDDPRFGAARGTLGLDARNRRWQLTDVVAGREPGEFWVATDGGGIVRDDNRSSRTDWFRYGLAGTGAATVALLDGAIWIGGDGRDARSGVAFTNPDLGTWDQQFRDDGAPGGFVAEIVRFGNAIWFAADDGLFRLAARPEPGTRGRWSRFTNADGLGSNRVRSLRPAGGLLWVGTDGGLTSFDTAGAALRQPLFPGRRVSRTAARHDTLFIAADDGLFTFVTAGGRSGATEATPRPYGRSPALRGRVTDVVSDDAHTFVIVDGSLLDADGTGAPIRDVAIDRIRPLFRLALHGGQLWVAGAHGIARRDPATRAWQAFTVPEDVPASPVVDVLVDGDHVWAATPAGAIRLRWR